MNNVDSLRETSTVNIHYNSYDDQITYNSPSILAKTQDIIMKEHDEIQKLLDENNVEPINGSIYDRVLNLINNQR